MPYRNALRDNWNRYQQANDAEMRLAARQQMQQAVPQGRYAGMSMSDMFRVLQGEAPQEYAPEQIQPQMDGQPPERDPNYNPQEGVDAIRRRKAQLAAALQEY